MVVVGAKEKMNKEENYVTYKDEIISFIIMASAFFIHSCQIERLESRIDRLEKKVLINE
jgi:hypothetical protein